jgi:polysaccharide export outer membrane protein
MNMIGEKYLRGFLCGVAIISACLINMGCGTFSDGAAHTTLSQTNAAPVQDFNLLRPDDMVIVEFAGVSMPPEKFQGRIKEDGTISLPLIQSVKAAGLTTGVLEKNIKEAYVPKFFSTNLAVNVNSESRFFTVDGDVRIPQRIVYAGQTTVLSAIASAGGFTDFANKKKVQLIRASGESKTINCLRARNNPKLDLPVYPFDKIIVPRRLY